MRPYVLALLCLPSLIRPAHAQWQLQDAHATADLRGIDNVGSGVAWASGSNGTILRTLDDGEHWQLCAKPSNGEHLDFRAIQAFDNNTAIIMSAGKGDLSRLYKTTDGCQSWHLLFTNPDKDGFWDALQFAPKGGVSRAVARESDRRFGVLLGDPVNGHFAVFLTLDGGDTWKPDSVLAKISGTGETAFAASNSLLAFSAGDEVPSLVTGGSRSELLSRERFQSKAASRDVRGSGAIWSRVELPFAAGTSSGAFSIAAASDDEGVVVVGGDYQHPNEAHGTAVYSLDFGSFFHPAQTPPHGYRSAVAYDPKTKTWITVGPNGTDISTDDGRNWRALKPDPSFHDTPDADQHWNALSLPYAVGPQGRIGKLRNDALMPVQAWVPSPPILVNSVVFGQSGDLGRDADALAEKGCNGNYIYLDHPSAVGDFIGGKARVIQVVRFAATLSVPKEESISKAIKKVWNGRFRSASCQINWAEGTPWSIEAIVKFDDGKQTKLITDGSHLAFQDHSGKSWFTRLLPSAQ